MAKKKVKEVKQPKKNGRPAKYTKEIADAICLEIATTSKGLKKICSENEAFPSYVTVFKWLMEEDKKDFLNSYTCAREAQADILADEIIQIADDGTNDTQINGDGVEITNHDVIARSRLRVDARKFLAAKLKPKKYGDKLDVTSDNKPISGGISITTWIQENMKNASTSKR